MVTALFSFRYSFVEWVLYLSLRAPASHLLPFNNQQALDETDLFFSFNDFLVMIFSPITKYPELFETHTGKSQNS